MITVDFDLFVEEYHRALDAFFRGDPKPAQALYSHRDDATLANPFGPIATGWAAIADATERAASNYSDGEQTRFETMATCVTPELAYLVEVERFRARVGGNPEVASGALRVTSILRREGDVWRIVHRHADPITSARPAESVLQS
jgi:ketosteroid isomerase-like protein